jgi:hypothetical protein
MPPEPSSRCTVYPAKTSPRPNGMGASYKMAQASHRIDRDWSLMLRRSPARRGERYDPVPTVIRSDTIRVQAARRTRCCALTVNPAPSNKVRISSGDG